MDFKIDFDPAEVATKLHEAIASSTFKEMFTQAAQKHIEEITKQSGWNQSYTSLVDNVIRDFVRQTMDSVLRKEYLEKVTEIVKIQLDKKLPSLVEKFIDRLQLPNY